MLKLTLIADLIAEDVKEVAFIAVQLAAITRALDLATRIPAIRVYS